MQDEPIHVKCDYCGEMFTTSRADLDNISSQVTSISSQFGIPLVFPHPILTGVECHYAIIADQGDFCMKCCIMFLKTGLIKLSQQVNNETISLDL